VDGRVLADKAVGADHNSGGLCAGAELIVLGLEADAGKRPEDRAIANDGGTVDIVVADEPDAPAKTDLADEHAVWADLDIIRELGLLGDRRGRVDQGHPQV